MDTPRQREGTDLDTITSKIQESINTGKYTLQELQGALVDKTREAARTTDQMVHENPWAAIGVAAGVGLIVGLILSRR